MRIRNSFERLSDWQENYIECLSRVCVILEVGYKVYIREFREFEKQIKEDKRHLGVYCSNAEPEL